MATGRGSSAREGTAKAVVADQISQAIQSTSNLLLLMQQSSHSQARLAKLPKNLLEKTESIRNTGQVLDRLPLVISSLDAHMENGLHRIHWDLHERLHEVQGQKGWSRLLVASLESDCWGKLSVAGD